MIQSEIDGRFIDESHIGKTADFLKEKLQIEDIDLGLILGSGLGFVTSELENSRSLPYSEIEGFASSTVKGHGGELYYGSLEGKRILAMQGRSHLYEGLPLQRIVFPIRVMKTLGVQRLMITNASGAVNEDYRRGDLMLIDDHINFSFTNPLIGKNIDGFGPRFPDNAKVYDEGLKNSLKGLAENQSIDLKQGVYFYFTGPAYETPAEIRMARTLGADVVGMSTFPEALAAAHCGIRVASISYISNMAAGITNKKLDHEEVIRIDERARSNFAKLLHSFLKEI